MASTSATGWRLIRSSGSLATGSSYASEGTPWHEVLNVGDTTVTYLIVEPKAP